MPFFQTAPCALAPMAGITDTSFRRLCHEQGASFTVSEMVSAKGFLHAPENARALSELLHLDADEGAVGLQLFGHEPAVLAEAAARLESRGFAFIDINMGCPAPKIVSNGDGSALMRDEALAARCVEAVSRAVRLPVTVKMRSGWDERSVNAPRLARLCEEAGARMICVHARTRNQLYAGRADLDVIAQVKRAVRIPVLGNGDIFSGEDALAMLRQTGCDGVMVGRGARGNPWIFAQIRAALSGAPCEAPDFASRIRMALRHMDDMAALRGEKSAALEMRKHISWYLQGARGAAQLRARINALTDADQVRAALRERLALEQDNLLKEEGREWNLR